jgi:tripartite ATP-independent transporter DctM subunit
MGYMLEGSGLMTRLFSAIQLLLAKLNGSLYVAVTVTSTVFGAATGIVGSSVSLIGVMAGPTMVKSKYNVRLSAGCITAGGTLGILIPPSIMLVVMGPVIGVPVTDLFAAAIIPGIMLAAIYTVYTLVRCMLNPSLGPAVPEEMIPDSKMVIVMELVKGVLPVAGLIAATLGTILLGMATPTEGAACGAAGSVVLSMIYRRLNWKVLKTTLLKTFGLSSMLLILVGASLFFGAVFSRLGSAKLITEVILGLHLNPMLMLIAIMITVFILGWPLEWVPILLIFIPILLPVINALNINLTWFGILVAVTLQTAWLSPPVALSAYFLKGVLPSWALKDIYIGMGQFMVLQMLGVGLLLALPWLATWLPEVLRR